MLSGEDTAHIRQLLAPFPPPALQHSMSAKLVAYGCDIRVQACTGSTAWAISYGHRNSLVAGKSHQYCILLVPSRGHQRASFRNPNYQLRTRTQESTK